MDPNSKISNVKFRTSYICGLIDDAAEVQRSRRSLFWGMEPEEIISSIVSASTTGEISLLEAKSILTKGMTTKMHGHANRGLVGVLDRLHQEAKTIAREHK